MSGSEIGSTSPGSRTRWSDSSLRWRRAVGTLWSTA